MPNRSLRLLAVTAVLVSFVFSTHRTTAEDAFTLHDGDRVVMIGDGLIEQEQYFGWIEVMLTTSFPESQTTFRNLGWNADTPAGDSRAGLSLVQAGREPADEGWKQLQKQIDLTEPTVAILGYGMANALQVATESDPQARKQMLARFRSNYTRLVERVRKTSPDCEFVFLSPIMPVGDSVLRPDVIDVHAGVVRDVSQQSGGHFVDLTTVANDPEQRKDAVHLNGEGYRRCALAIQSALNVEDSGWASNPVTESLRQIILEKNRLWFHRSRPANMAYVFGFRKHEQGQNAVEIPQFDPLIEAEEKRIAALRSLENQSVEPKQPRLKSKFAEFTPQPHPEFTVADGLEITLWAENPLLNKPIHMNFDAQGRLWVVSSEAYPMIEVGQALPDKILVLEDTDQDGKADESTVFADELLIPTGIAPGDGGVYVAQSTDLLFLKDTDGDNQADQRTRVLSGFGTEDTHHNLHTLLFGPDGRLYMNQSVYTRTDTETPHGVVRLRAGGAFRYDTQTGKMQTFFHGLWNPWGHQFDRIGHSFMTDGAGFAGIAYVFPGATFRPTPGARQELDLISPGNYPKFCSAEIVYGDSFPDDWQGSLVTCDFRANRVTRFSIDPQGSGFVTTQQPDLLRTTESTFRPIDVKQGPDGALYIADWSNPIINHGEVDFRDPRRDRWHGRIWRVAFKDKPVKKPIDLTEQSLESLFDSLLSDDRYRSDKAFRVLVDRAEETRTQLKRLWDRCEQSHHRLIATRLSAAVDAPNQAWLDAALQDSDGNARSAATRILADWSDPTDPSRVLETNAAMERFTRSINDDHPRVRLEAIRGLARLGGIDAIRLSLTALQHPTDRFIDHALFLTVDESSDALIADLSDSFWEQPINQPAFEFVLTSVEPGRATQFLTRYLTEHEIPRDGSGPWIDLIAKAGAPEQLDRLYQTAIRGNLTEDARRRVLEAMRDAKRLRRVQPSFSSKPGADLKPLLSAESAAVRAAAIELVGVWKLRYLVPDLAGIASNGNADASLRLRAVEALRACGGNRATDALTSLTQSDATQQIKIGAVSALAALAPESAIDPFFAVLSKIDDEQTALALWRSMLSAKSGSELLTQSVNGRELSESAARAGVRAAQEGNRDADALVRALMPMTGTTMTASKWDRGKAREILRLVELKGDPYRGEWVYRRKELQCTTCHAIGGIGGKVGPDMTSLGASAPVDYIIESMFDPNAKVKENYHAVTVLTDSGKIYSGIESGSTDDEMVLRDASNHLVRIPQAEIIQSKPAKSLMPEGLLDRVPQQDQLDLIRFLTRLGKPGDFDASRQTVARVLEVFAGTHRIEQQGNESIISGEREKGWKSIQTRVSGKIDRETLRRMTAQPINISLVNIYLRTNVEASSDGEATVTIDNIDRGRVWVDGDEAGELGQAFDIEAGDHALLIQIDARDLPEWLRIRSEQLTFKGSD